MNENLPFIMYNHYWDLNNNPSKKETVKKIYEYAISDGSKLVSVSECYRKRTDIK